MYSFLTISIESMSRGPFSRESTINTQNNSHIIEMYSDTIAEQAEAMNSRHKSKTPIRHWGQIPFLYNVDENSMPEKPRFHFLSLINQLIQSNIWT
jgi:hypothetical protein